MEAVRNSKRHIPNIITCLNLFSGCVATLMAFEGYLVAASFLVFLAAAFDFLDGLAARILKVFSPFGKELDSMADIISFGFAPAAIVFAYLKLDVLGDVQASFNPYILTVWELALLFSAFIIPVFTGLRLAKFNIDTRQTDSFIGIPSTANGIFWASWPLVLEWGDYTVIETWLTNPRIIIPLIIASSLLMVSKLPMFALKVKNLQWSDNKIRYSFLFAFIVTLVFLKWLAIPMAIVLYVLFSAIQWLLNKY